MLRHARTREVAVFACRMHTERRGADGTDFGCFNVVDFILNRLDECGGALESVRIADIDAQLAIWHARGLSRVAAKDYAERSSTIFRFAGGRGWCMAGLADGIMPPRFRPGGTIPKRLNRDEVERLLATTEGGRPAAAAGTPIGPMKGPWEVPYRRCPM